MFNISPRPVTYFAFSFVLGLIIGFCLSPFYDWNASDPLNIVVSNKILPEPPVENSKMSAKREPILQQQPSTAIHSVILPELPTESDIDIDSQLSEIDNQIQYSLQLNESSATQEAEILQADTDLLGPLYSLSYDEQIQFIDTLIESNHDHAVVALADLILSDDTTVQQKAVNGLITILKQHTGHFDQIAEILSHNAVFLNDEQLQRVQNLTAMP